MNFLIVIFLIILALYGFEILKYKYNWRRLPEFIHSDRNCSTAVSIIVPFRNELGNLQFLLESLHRQNYPSELYEVILIDDHSDDGSETVAKSFCEVHRNFRLYQNGDQSTGKKSALTVGIQNASFDCIVTSDADCVMDENWLSTIASFYEKEKPDMIIGLVDMNAGDGFFNNFQEMEFLSIIAVGAGAAADERPIYCSAASLAYKRRLFLSFTDPLRRSITSGDDTLFLHRLKKDRKYKVLLLKSRSAKVYTKKADSWKEFCDQRKRWVSKSRYYHDKDVLYMGLMVFLMNMVIIGSMALCFSGMNYGLFPIVLTLKTLADYSFIHNFLNFYGKRVSVLIFTLYELIYPFYAVYFAITGIFSGYYWKGRKHKAYA
jgi:poly-beta-1,6-N-acetyl-D-glucosamine synthase